MTDTYGVEADQHEMYGHFVPLRIIASEVFVSVVSLSLESRSFVGGACLPLGREVKN
jgi:hypothetical protein